MVDLKKLSLATSVRPTASLRLPAQRGGEFSCRLGGEFQCRLTPSRHRPRSRRHPRGLLGALRHGVDADDHADARPRHGPVGRLPARLRQAPSAGDRRVRLPAGAGQRSPSAVPGSRRALRERQRVSGDIKTDATATTELTVQSSARGRTSKLGCSLAGRCHERRARGYHPVDPVEQGGSPNHEYSRGSGAHASTSLPGAHALPHRRRGTSCRSTSALSRWRSRD